MRDKRRRRGSKQPDEQPDYGSLAYWDARHKGRDDQAAKFEWFASFEDIRPFVATHLKRFRTGVVVDLGCGLSRLIVDVAAAWPALRCIGVDFSNEAVRVMRASPNLPDNVSFAQADASQSLGFASACVLVLDKSLMDTLLHANDGETRVASMLRRVALQLCDGGAWMCMTQLDPRKADDDEFLRTVVLAAFAEACPEAHWALTAHVSDTTLLVLRKHVMHSMLGKRRQSPASVVALKISVYY